MPEHLSFLPAAGAAFLTLACVAWLIGVTRMLRRFRAEAAMAWPASPGEDTALPAMPGPRETGPRREAVELTPAEREAFAGLVRRLDSGH
ncbi:hypothetical protein C3489_01825 [Streptomyces sp. Ru71]|uniref:hypothetical protein n=1 Tax=Streptomyces sp. Ru71 TaxID=2080746 RepID=UPI000CDDF1DD|nr:hypothetical protein [Streptomyces sp. Ru71]POX57014.1 hypothetical protein C3489_01825 [Streptomyces sp. Ru71]